MNTIDILTTQNVTIQYALAPARDRIFSFIIDVLMMGITLLLMSLLLASVFDGQAQRYAQFIFSSIFFFFYSLGSEILMNGQSIGKRLIGLKIVKVTGTDPTLSDYLIRWAFRFIDIWFSLGSIATIMVSSGKRNQRLGDLLANTTVIKLNPWANVSLNEILAIHSIETYKPTYPQVKQFTEKEMLFIKNALERFRQFNNQAHREALAELSEKIGKRLGVSALPYDRLEFLKVVINDYVVLSR